MFLSGLLLEMSGIFFSGTCLLVYLLWMPLRIVVRNVLGDVFGNDFRISFGENALFVGISLVMLLGIC